MKFYNHENGTGYCYYTPFIGWNDVSRSRYSKTACYWYQSPHGDVLAGICDDFGNLILCAG